MRAVLGLAAALALMVSGAARAADAVADALGGNDPVAVADALKNPLISRSEKALLTGTAAAMRFDDEGAIEALDRGLRDTSLAPRARRRALTLLGGVYLRAGKYAAAAKTLDAALAVSDPSQDESDRRSLRQTHAVAHALRAEPAQTHEPSRAGSAPITRDAVNLPRARGQVNGVAQDFVIDTGAGFSTMTRSTAVKLKLRLLPVDVTVGSVTAHSVPAMLGVADDLEIAGNRFRHVAFLVLADEALKVAGGAYQIDAILGFPVLARLGRIEFARAKGGEIFRVVTKAGVPTLRGIMHDFYLDTLRPMAIVDLGGIGRVRMLIDTGASHSSLNATFAATYPQALRNTPAEKSTIGGAGAVTTSDVRVLRDVAVTADGVARRLERITVSDETRSEHGALGQDLLQADGGFVLDFAAMDFAFLPAK